MKRVMIAILATSLFASAPAMVIAQDDQTNDQTNDITTEQYTVKRRSEYKNRLNEYKENFRDKLNKAQEDKLKGICTNVEKKLTTTKDRISDFDSKHQDIYVNWREKLGNISVRLVQKGVDTTTLDSLLEQLDEFLSSNVADIQAYISELELLDTMQCSYDPSTFYDSLQELRAARSLIIANHKETVAFIKDEIKAELVNIVTQLQASETVEEGAE